MHNPPKQTSGGDGWFSSATPAKANTPATPDPKADTPATPDPKANTPATLGSLADADTSAESAGHSRMVGVAAVASNVALAALASTGVGIPVAGALGVVLVLTGLVAKTAAANLALHSVLLDVSSIIFHCYRINALVDRTTDLCTVALFAPKGTALNDAGGLAEARKSQASQQTKAGPLLEKIQVDPDLKRRLLAKIGELTAFILKIVPDNVIDILQRDTATDEHGVGKLVETEAQSRHKRGATVGKIGRSFQRITRAGHYNTEIVKNLAIIQGFFVLMKAQYDTALDYYAAHMDPAQWVAVRTAMENSKEYRDYLLPPDAPVLDSSVTAAAVTDVKNAVLEAEKVESAVEEQKGPTGGTRRKKGQRSRTLRRPRRGARLLKSWGKK